MEVHVEEKTCLTRLPSRRTVLASLVIIAAMLTLILINLTGRWVGHRVTQSSKKHVGIKQRFGSSVDEQRTLQHLTNKMIGMSEGDLQDGGWKRRDKSLSRSNSRSSSDEIHVDVENIGSSSIQTVPTERRELDPSNKYTAWDLTNAEKHRSQTNKTGMVLRGAIPGDQSVDNTRKVIQGTIRDAMMQIKTLKPMLKRNLYLWNDRDPISYRSLPIQDKENKEWKRNEAIIFNRVGKCGSRSVIEILRHLSAMNNFNFVCSIVYNMTSIGPEWQKYIVKSLDRVKTPYLFQRHLHFVNFSEYHAKQPAYINIIRDPLSRMVSAYYFRRFGDGKSSQHFKGNEEEKYRSVTECILHSHKECTEKGSFYIIPFFCGQQKACRQPSQWALDRAKQNVKDHFIAVGILEDLENSFRVFEKLLPRYFTGVIELFKDPQKQEAKTVTKNKEKPSSEADAIMKRIMHYEYDFYYFVKERLAKLKLNYGIEDVR